MAQDLRQLFKDDKQISRGGMPEGHEKRFLDKLDKAMPAEPRPASHFKFLKYAAAIILFIALGISAYFVLSDENQSAPVKMTQAKSLEDISPELKKVEDYYLASINLELSRLDYSEENKELFDGYLRRLGELSAEYERLSKELLETGPTEQNVSALIDNLKLRLNLMYRLKDKLNELKNEDNLESFQG